jgi:hypothetical protein
LQRQAEALLFGRCSLEELEALRPRLVTSSPSAGRFCRHRIHLPN